MIAAYYNEFDPKAAAGLKQLIVDGLIPKGDVDDRSITEVTPSDLAGYTQCHFFAGIGGWSRALQLAGWPDDRPVWTGSCPCQPFSSAGKQKGGADHRHLWPVWHDLIRQCSPAKIYGEQVASAIPHGWLDGVYADMEAQGYAIGSAVLPACAVDAPHKRDRLWFMADSQSERGGRTWRPGSEASGGSEENNSLQFRGASGNGDVANAGGRRCGEPREREIKQPRGAEVIGTGCFMGDREHLRRSGREITGSDEKTIQDGATGPNSASQSPRAGNPGAVPFWSEYDWIICGDGKARRIPTVESGIRLLAHGIPERVGLLRAGGNAIVPEEAARFIKATM